MVLIRRKKQSPSEKAASKERRYDRTFEGFLQQLQDGDSTVRRWGARDLAAFPEAVPALLEKLSHEPSPAVREAILDSLLSIGNAAVVKGLIPFLRSDDAALRNQAIEVLQQLPNPMAPHMERLLTDPDSDVRIFALDIMQGLAHPRTVEWLIGVLERDDHINTLSVAVDRLLEVGTREALPALRMLKLRLGSEPYLVFAIESAIEAIEG